MSGGSKADESVGKLATGAAPIPNSVAKLAAALAFAVSVTVQPEAIPLQAPLQPANPQPAAGVLVTRPLPVSLTVNEFPALNENATPTGSVPVPPPQVVP